MLRHWVGIATLALVSSPALLCAQTPGRFARTGLVVGLEYALLDNPRLVSAMAEAFAETGLPGMKHYVEAVEWGAMQKGPNRPIDFRKFDLFVREYQNRGFTELTISLKPHSRWASKDVRRLRSTNGSPKPKYRAHFQRWVRAVVERYDADGDDDMPGLRWPVRYVEIGNEFSSYQPEPVDEYLETLRLAYEAAHQASETVLVGHAAFLTTPVNLDVSDPAEYDSVWAATRRIDTHHGLEDLRAILDHPESFDFINLHNLGDPYEIEHQMRWLAYETGRRGYSKPVVISDTTPTSYVAWGPATVCTGRMGVVAPPATEADRCRLADFFQRLVERDSATVAWTRGFVAADHVQRAVIAAEQGIRLINLAFVSDIWYATLKAFRAGAGISAWGGAIRINPFAGRVVERYPAFYAVRQLMSHLGEYRSVTRVTMPDPQARVYRFERAAGPLWVAWRDPRSALVPADGAPTLEIELAVGVTAMAVEPVITTVGQVDPELSSRPAPGGRLRLQLTHRPVFVHSGR